jgi:hypothetical protein
VQTQKQQLLDVLMNWCLLRRQMLLGDWMMKMMKMMRVAASLSLHPLRSLLVLVWQPEQG